MPGKLKSLGQISAQLGEGRRDGVRGSTLVPPPELSASSSSTPARREETLAARESWRGVGGVAGRDEGRRQREATALSVLKGGEKLRPLEGWEGEEGRKAREEGWGEKTAGWRVGWSRIGR